MDNQFYALGFYAGTICMFVGAVTIVTAVVMAARAIIMGIVRPFIRD